jgi:ABC-type branched-subunit amino acid transport system ATPase component
MLAIAQPNESKLLVVRSLAKAFGGVRAVVDVSLEVESGQTVGLIGPNGAGKTTVLSLVTGFLVPDRGSVRVLGLQTEKLSPHVIRRLGVARTFQQIRLFPNLTVLENCLAGMHVRFESSLLQIVLRTRRMRAEVREAVEDAHALLGEWGLANVSTQAAGTLPYGQQRRVEIVRALAGRPRLICLDEPGAGMNRKESDQLSELVAMTAASGIGVLLIEHDMRLIRNTCNSAVALKDGEVLASGRPAEVLADAAVIEAYLGGSRAGR